MPTPDQFRAARTLLGLTQYRCREMMGRRDHIGYLN